MVLYRRRSFETTVKIRPITGSRRLKSKPWLQGTPDSRDHKLTGAHQMAPYIHWNQAPHKGQQVPGQDISSKFSSNTGTQPWAPRHRLPKVTPNQRHLVTNYWTLHCTPERRNPAPPTRTQTQVPPTREAWQATSSTPPTGRRLHNKEEPQTSSLQKGHPKHSNLNKMKRQRSIQQAKEYDKCRPNQTKEEEIGSLPEK